MLDFLEKHKNIIGIILTFLGIASSLITGWVTSWIVGIGIFFGITLILVFLVLCCNRRPNIEKVKEKAKTLFIDDKRLQVVKNLKQNGFDVRKVYDVKSVDDEDVKWANIIFIDNKGVGKVLVKEKEGLGLAHFLKETYKNKKRYIIYSGEQDLRGLTGNIISIRKNASMEEFISIICSEYQNL